MAGARLAHFHLPDWARTLLPMARDLGLTLACDLQDVVDLDDPYRRDFSEASDYLFFSAANQRSPDPFIRRLLKRNPAQVIVAGMGRKGCALGTRDGIRHFPPVPLATPVLDTNGAGDALAVGFLASRVLEGRSLEEAVTRGQILARHTCGLRADSEHLMTKAQLEMAFAQL